MIDYLWILIALPLIGAVTLVLFGKRIGAPAAGWLASGLIVADFAFAAALAADFFGAGAEIETVYLFSWIPVLGVDASLLWDPLAAVMTLVVTGVGALIHIYAIGYMRGDDRFPRFFAYMNLFIASMLILVLADNFAVMFVGWELVGLSSYLLISFWFIKPVAAAAGKKAFIVNRIGDWGFLVALMLIFAAFGTFDFATVFEEAPTVLTVGMATAITLLLFVGAIGKSAQIPLYVWLPDAMEGPTPVSALIHAATMVTAGVYMIARTAALFQLAPTTGAVVDVVERHLDELGLDEAAIAADMDLQAWYLTLAKILPNTDPRERPLDRSRLAELCTALLWNNIVHEICGDFSPIAGSDDPEDKAILHLGKLRSAVIDGDLTTPVEPPTMADVFLMDQASWTSRFNVGGNNILAINAAREVDDPKLRLAIEDLQATLGTLEGELLTRNEGRPVRFARMLPRHWEASVSF